MPARGKTDDADPLRIDHAANDEPGAQASGPASEGLFHEDTRFLSRLVLVVNGARPLLLSSAATADNAGSRVGAVA